MAYVRKHTVYIRVPLSGCCGTTGKAPTKTGWADTNKGIEGNPKVRSRWVAKELNTGPRPELFAPTSPVEGVKLVLSKAASIGRGDTVVLIVDVRRAYFYAKATREVFIELPQEDWKPGDEQKCGLLQQSLYGTRDAVLSWERELSNFLSSLGFTRGKASPCLHHNERRGVSAVVHGDDVTCVASRKEVEWVLEQFRRWVGPQQEIDVDP